MANIAAGSIPAQAERLTDFLPPSHWQPVLCLPSSLSQLFFFFFNTLNCFCANL